MSFLVLIAALVGAVMLYRGVKRAAYRAGYWAGRRDERALVEIERFDPNSDGNQIIVQQASIAGAALADGALFGTWDGIDRLHGLPPGDGDHASAFGDPTSPKPR